MGKINLLPPRLSSRIAAGEVIDRPQAILREFLDNAIDAKADSIEVSIEGGGIDKIKVKDNGGGISREDLELIASPHATSKIHKEDDLYSIETLGFRGEALYSIAAVSTLKISTSDRESGVKSTLTIDNGVREEILSFGPEEGTEISSENLFYDIPARRSFLKRSSTEAMLCKSLFISKALAFPNISFTLKIDGATKLVWQKSKNLKERVMMLYRDYSILSSDVYYLEKEEDEYTVRVVTTSSAVKRSDKKEIRIYVNGRPVEEFSLVQAVIYGYGELLPGGSYPYSAVFITDKPELVDFNIHPAKKEVKIRNIAEIHHTLSSLIKNGVERKIPEIKESDNQFYLFDSATRWEKSKKVESFGSKIEEPHTLYKIEKPISKINQIPTNTYTPKDNSWLEKAKELKKAKELERERIESLKKEEREVEPNKDEVIYIGQAFRLFLICERNNSLYLVDQHAAHERILYDEIISQETIQNLLVPIAISVDDITDEYLLNHCYIYTKLGIMLSQKSKGEWEIDALPAVCKGIEDKIIDFVSNCKSDEHQLEESLFATMACKAAIKMGDEVDRFTAEAILEKVFKMEEPCCPHGRTFLIKLTKENLMKMVGRT